MRSYEGFTERLPRVSGCQRTLKSFGWRDKRMRSEFRSVPSIYPIIDVRSGRRVSTETEEARRMQTPDSTFICNAVVLRPGSSPLARHGRVLLELLKTTSFSELSSWPELIAKTAGYSWPFSWRKATPKWVPLFLGLNSGPAGLAHCSVDISRPNDTEDCS